MPTAEKIVNSICSHGTWGCLGKSKSQQIISQNSSILSVIELPQENAGGGGGGEEHKITYQKVLKLEMAPASKVVHRDAKGGEPERLALFYEKSAG